MAEITKKFIALAEVSAAEGKEQFEFLFAENEVIIKAYRSIRDRLILTNKRLIAIDIQGVTGKKKEFFVIPYHKISAYAVETAGTFDLDSELKVWVSGLGELQFEFLRHTKIQALLNVLNQHI